MSRFLTESPVRLYPCRTRCFSNNVSSLRKTLAACLLAGERERRVRVGSRDAGGVPSTAEFKAHIQHLRQHLDVRLKSYRQRTYLGMDPDPVVLEPGRLPGEAAWHGVPGGATA